MPAKKTDKTPKTETAPKTAKPVFDDATVPPADDAAKTPSTLDMVTKMAKDNSGLIAAGGIALLSRHPLGRLAGAFLSTESGQKVAKQALDVAGTAVTQATGKTPSELCGSAAQKITGLIKGGKKDGGPGQQP
jgi:hypothetical protein